MASWKSRGLRGSMLEEMINITNSKYREKRLALIQKVPTPITPISIDKENRHVNLAYFEQKSNGGLYRCGTGNTGMLRCKGMCRGYI